MGVAKIGGTTICTLSPVWVCHHSWIGFKGSCPWWCKCDEVDCVHHGGFSVVNGGVWF